MWFADKPSGQGPKVIKKPVPLILEEGQTAKFECEMSAVPSPEVQTILSVYVCINIDGGVHKYWWWWW